MDLISLTTEEVRNLFKYRNVILIGDSIVRGIYKDLYCILTDNNRLLSSIEMKFNRHQLKQETSFGETIEKFPINRTNSTFNIEKRLLKSETFGYDITYLFTSRIWNRQMIQLLSSLNEYDIIIINSQIWDLSRYKDYKGELYMKNLDTFFSKISHMKNKIIWLSNAPINNSKDSSLSRVLSKTNPLTISKAQQYDIHTLDLYRLVRA